MKLLTLNSHSLLEEDYLKKTQIFVEEILQENIDVFALQEVNQSHDDKILAKNPHNYYVDLSKKLWDIKHELLSI